MSGNGDAKDIFDGRRGVGQRQPGDVGLTVSPLAAAVNVPCNYAAVDKRQGDVGIVVVASPKIVATRLDPDLNLGGTGIGDQAFSRNIQCQLMDVAGEPYCRRALSQYPSRCIRTSGEIQGPTDI